jgi:hypothetical protein
MPFVCWEKEGAARFEVSALRTVSTDIAWMPIGCFWGDGLTSREYALQALHVCHLTAAWKVKSMGLALRFHACHLALIGKMGSLGVLCKPWGCTWLLLG